MDYPFFIRVVSAIDDALIREMAAVALRMPYTTHPHFNAKQPVTAYIGPRDMEDELGKLLKVVIPSLGMDRSTPDMWEVNKLPAGKTIFEHTDLASQDGAQAAKVDKSHKIHIPLITNHQCRFGHRRTKSLPIHYQRMPVGFAYAYNNYVWHDVVNSGTGDRYQLTVRFWDPDWVEKAHMLQQFGIPTHNNFEE